METSPSSLLFAIPKNILLLPLTVTVVCYALCLILVIILFVFESFVYPFYMVYDILWNDDDEEVVWQ